MRVFSGCVFGDVERAAHRHYALGVEATSGVENEVVLDVEE